jgi:hypothetical protein
LTDMDRVPHSTLHTHTHTHTLYQFNCTDTVRQTDKVTIPTCQCTISSAVLQSIKSIITIFTRLKIKALYICYKHKGSIYTQNTEICIEINTIQELLEKMANVTYLKNMGTCKLSEYENFQKQLIIRKVCSSS